MDTDDWAGILLRTKLQCNNIIEKDAGWAGCSSGGTYYVSRAGLRRYVESITREDAAAVFGDDVPVWEAALRLLSETLSTAAHETNGTIRVEEDGTVSSPPPTNQENSKTSNPHDHHWVADPTQPD